MPGLAWVTGAGGLIGSHIVAAGPRWAPDWEVRPLTRQQLDLLDTDAVAKAFRSDHPQVVIHCAAISKSPLCQSDPSLAWQTNTRATEHLAELGSRGRFVFFSTDLVFDGSRGQYEESAAVHPLSIYAETKVA